MTASSIKLNRSLNPLFFCSTNSC